MRIRHFVVMLAVALAAAAVNAAEVTTDWDHGVDFSAFKTYAWTAENRFMARDDLMRGRLVEDVNQQLQSKGLELREAEAQLSVVVRTSEHDQKVLNTWGFGPGWRGWGGWGSMTTNVENIPEGNLVIDLVERPGDRLVWRAIANHAIPSNPDKASDELAAVVAKMFKDFPPKNAKK